MVATACCLVGQFGELTAEGKQFNDMLGIRAKSSRERLRADASGTSTPAFPQPGHEIFLNTGRMSQRTPTGQFVPGHTGNPGGRPGLPAEVRARLSALSLPAVQALADALYGDDARVRVVAAAHILDRLYGRPAQATDLTLKAEAIDASAAHLAARVAAAR